ncbi:MAG: DNA translocase FtsK [Xenococcaceae cyanobacterium MO_167.B27]|nr:DNA translocase FtsK [Xenococcaceae cyanobacterium MO_167.B27]
MSQFDRYYQQGLLLLKQGNNRGAIAALTEAIKLEPNYANTYSFRGEAHSELGNYTEALADFSKAIALSPQEAYLYCLRGWTKEELSDYQGAILDFDRAIALNYHDANIHISRGYAHRVLGNLQNAIADYTKAIAIDSENWNGYSHRGYARQAAGDISGAIEDFTKVIQLNPNDADAKKQLSSLIKAESVQLQGKSGLWIGKIGAKLKNVFGRNNQDRELTLIYRPKYSEHETISDPSFANLERVIDELWQEAQYIIKEETSRFTGHFILEDSETKDYIQGMWDTRFYPAGGFHLEWSCNSNRSWLPLPQTDSEAKEILRLWLEDIQACSALNWEIIGDSDPMSLEHPSRRGFKIIHLLKQYEAGERNFRRENLSNANLFEADLQGINLSHACLVGADLRGANLIRANLAEADLRDSCLIENEFITTVKQEPQFKDLFEPSAKQLKLEAVASQMQDIFYSVVFFPNYLQPTIQTKPDLAPALNQIWQGLRNLIQQWTQLLIKNRAYSNADEIFDRTFVSTESKLEFDFNLPDGTQQSIVGRLDCLIYDYSKGRPCVVELKTYAPVDPSAQLAQVALYSYMIQQLKKVPVDSAVYCVLPEFKEYHYAWSELETNLHQVIPFKLQQMQQWLEWQPSQPDAPPPTSNSALCSICPQQKKCQSFFTDEPPQLPDDPPIEPETIGRELVETLKSFKVNVEYIGAIAGPTFTRIKLKPGKGVKVASILKLASDLQVQLGIVRPPLISTQPGYVSVDLPREDRQIAYFKDYIQPQKKSDRAAVTIAIGVDLEGKLVEADLADSNNCHFLIGGTPGSGKSEFLRSLLLSLIYRHSPEQVKIALVDPKRVTFPEFTQMPWLLSPVVKDSEAAISLMEELVREMDKRYKIFETAGCPHLDAYNQKQTSSKHNLPRIVCIFDEYADFMVEKETRNALETSIKRLGGMARAAGIHLIIATQRPEASVVTPIIRDNLPGRIALSTSGSEANSKIILGGTQTEGAYLLGKGDLLYQVGAQLQRLQSLFADLVRLPSYQEQINFIPDRQNNL